MRIGLLLILVYRSMERQASVRNSVLPASASRSLDMVQSARLCVLLQMLSSNKWNTTCVKRLSKPVMTIPKDDPMPKWWTFNLQSKPSLGQKTTELSALTIEKLNAGKITFKCIRGVFCALWLWQAFWIHFLRDQIGYALQYVFS